jgi:hypothetical protein
MINIAQNFIDEFRKMIESSLVESMEMSFDIPSLMNAIRCPKTNDVKIKDRAVQKRIEFRLLLKRIIKLFSQILINGMCKKKKAKLIEFLDKQYHNLTIVSVHEIYEC